ncbi:MAG: phosphopantothenoylcysteine decarboxylase/phosphopantothenate--cysteine ligase [Bacteroidia bacterium]|jgi:phosphopantothenoylcysteine decarboxylase/phosphopantothenate--cysteine ligase
MADKPLQGKKVLITAGPTFEAIDPVRFIGNRSSGKMGIALAEEAFKMGADVTLILGPTHLVPKEKSIKLIRVESAKEMYDEAVNIFNVIDIAIMAAAVADYRPKSVADQKMKKSESILTLQLEKTEDILQTLGNTKEERQFLVGFALETNNELANAQGKLKRKNADLIVLNSLNDKGAGFGVDTNRVSLIFRNGNIIRFELASKQIVAQNILESVVAHIDNE